MSNTTTDQQTNLSSIVTQGITVLILYWVIRLAGIYVWSVLGIIGTVILGLMAILASLGNIGILMIIIEKNDGLGSGELSASEHLLPLILKILVDVGALYLTYLLYLRFF